jgi:hypothetical protein
MKYIYCKVELDIKPLPSHYEGLIYICMTLLHMFGVNRTQRFRELELNSFQVSGRSQQLHTTLSTASRDDFGSQ